METQNSNIAASNEGATTETYTEKTTAYNDNELSDFSGHVNVMSCALVEALTKTRELIAICVYGDETRAILCGGHPDKEGKIDYNEWKEGYSMWLRDNVSDITADKVIDYILEHQDEFNII